MICQTDNLHDNGFFITQQCFIKLVKVMAATRDLLKETAKWFESEFKCTKAHEIFHTLAHEKEKFKAKIMAEPQFKDELGIFISALIGETNRTLPYHEKQKCTQFCEQLGQINYLFDIYPNLGAQVIRIAANRYNKLFDKHLKPTEAEFSSLINYIIDTCPRVSIFHYESYNKWICSSPSPIIILNTNTHRKLCSFLRERANKLSNFSIKKEGLIRQGLTKRIKRIDLSVKVEKQIKAIGEQKRDEVMAASNPLISVWHELTKRLHKKRMNQTTKEFLVIFQEICRALATGKNDDATFILLAGIQINAESSSSILSSRTRAKLLIELILPFTSFHSKFTSDQLLYVEYLHHEFANRLFEIGEYLQNLFKGLQTYFNQHATESALFHSLIATPKGQPLQNLCLWGVQKKSQLFGLFGLNNTVVGMQESLDRDPEESLFPAELKSP